MRTVHENSAAAQGSLLVLKVPGVPWAFTACISLNVLLLFLLHRARADLASKTDIADVRRVRPYGLQFYLDWTTRLEVARGAAAGVEYMHQVSM